ncbi:MAG: NAD(P)-dependent oxidoreductase [Desulfuromonas sp.]|nr:MAG: NAD(P)-dependent oxidoreductase [Desulfuromonas sp.]
MGPVLIIGCGDVGLRLARQLLASGRPVSALARSAERAQELREAGLQVVEGDLDAGDHPIEGLPSAGATVYYLAPPPGGGTVDTRLRVFLGSIEPGNEPAKVIYMSTTGVYGDCGGALIDETAEAKPTTARGQRRLDAENLLRQWGNLRKVAVVVLRVAGIYGPGKLPLNRLQEGQPVIDDPEAPQTNRIHVDDLVQVCLAAEEKGEDGDLFNVCDDEGGTMSAYFDAVADAFSLPRPARIPMDQARQILSPLMISYFSESRRLDNRRMHERLRVSLRYPRLAEGLAALVAETKENG